MGRCSRRRYTPASTFKCAYMTTTHRDKNPPNNKPVALANPGDCLEAGYDKANVYRPTATKKPGAAQAVVDKPQVDKPRVDERAVDKPRFDKPQGDKPRGTKSRADKPHVNKPRPDKPQGRSPPHVRTLSTLTNYP